MATKYRYQVCDPICGVVDAAPRKAEAFVIARAHDCPHTTVFDTMASYGWAEEWALDGTVLSRR